MLATVPLSQCYMLRKLFHKMDIAFKHSVKSMYDEMVTNHGPKYCILIVF